MSPRACDACGKLIGGDGALLSVGGQLRQRIERAELCAKCSEAWLAWLRHYHASKVEVATAYRRSLEAARR